MNSKEHLLVCLMEEAAEVQKAASKMLRFGPCEYSPVDPAMVTNREALAREIYDFTEVVELLLKEGLIAEHPSEGWMNAHRASYNQHLDIAIKLGRVKNNVNNKTNLRHQSIQTG